MNTEELKRNIGYYSGTRPEMVNFIPAKSRKILDVGCSDGSFGASLQEHLGAEVWGVEIDEKAAKTAEKKLKKVYTGRFEQYIAKLPKSYFDCVVFNDVLEHLENPWEVLKDIRPLISRDGVVVASIPNFRFWANLANILVKGEWKYEESGILDKTHLRFFTYKSMASLFLESGYEIVSIEGIHPDSNIKFKLLNLLFLGKLKDMQFTQFAVVAKVNS